MVAGQDAEAARINRQRLNDAELEREVPDHQWRPGVEEGRMALVVLLHRLPGELQQGAEIGPRRHRLNSLRAEPGQQRDGVVASLLPLLGAQGLEDLADPRFPAPAEVEGQSREFVEQAVPRIKG